MKLEDNPLTIKKGILKRLVLQGMTEDQLKEYLVNHLYVEVHKILEEIKK